jgi:hypothetical protein
MPLGPSARRYAPAPLAAALATALAGCNMLPYSARILPRQPEVWTRVEGEAPARSGDRVPKSDLPANSGEDGLPGADGGSRLPPAIERPADGRIDPASSSAPIRPISQEPAPPIDEAITRAGSEQPSTGLDLPAGVAPFEGFDSPATSAKAEPPPRSEAPPAVGKTEPPIPEPKPELKAPGAPPPLSEAPKAAADLLLPPSGSETPPSAAIPPSPGLPAPSPETLTPPVSPTLSPEAPKPIATPQPTENPPAPAEATVSPEGVWREGIERLRLVARERSKEASPGAPDWAGRERLLERLDRPESDGAQGPALVNSTPPATDPNVSPASRAEPPFEISELKLCRKVNGFGDIESLEPASRRAGQAVVLYCEVAGLRYEASGDGFRSRISAEIEAIPVGSETPAWSRSLGTLEDNCRRRRRDYYANYKLNLPEGLPPGDYRLRLRERDLANDRVATAETKLTITR